MILKENRTIHNGRSPTSLFVAKLSSRRDVRQLQVVVHDDPVMLDRRPGVAGLVAVGADTGGGELDIIGLPGEWRQARIDVFLGDFVNSAAIVVLPLEPERIENLDFVAGLKIHPTIAALLAA